MLMLFVTLMVLPLAVGLLLDWLRGRDPRASVIAATSIAPASRIPSRPPVSSRPPVAAPDQEPVSSRTLNQKCA